MAARRAATAPARRRGTGVRLAGLLTALLAAAGLVLLPGPADTSARAATATDSAVTKAGTDGPAGDFSQLKVTVEQTREMRAQGVRVTWTGGAPTRQGADVLFGRDFLQIMECWGDSAAGPDPEQCVFGQSPAGVASQATGRSVGYAPGSALEDPLDPGTSPSGHVIPFRPADGSPASTDIPTFFTPLNTNEQAVTKTDADGTGETVFSVLSGAEANILGCGRIGDDGKAHPCWLVVVPRGDREPNGSTPDYLRTSPLSATNWAQRIVFRLDFKPLAAYCPIGAKEQQTVGTEMVSEAMTAWEPTLCTSDKVTFNYLVQTEDFARSQAAHPTTGGPGVGFVQNPVPEESGSPPVVHAPVAVSGLVLAYNIQVNASSRQVPRIRLNARLVAKMLTQSYQCDLPGDNTQFVRGRLSPKNPQDIQWDPEFTKLNPDSGFAVNASCIYSLQVPQGPSDYAAELWRWLRSDADAKGFLEGKPDPWGMTVNPTFLALKPAQNPLSEFPKPDPTAWVPNPDYPNISITAVSQNPYGGSLLEDATRLRNANNTGLSGFGVGSIPPQPQKTSGQRFGQYFDLGLTDAATAARYRLGTAELLNADGQFVAPTGDGLLKSVAGMKDGQVPGVLDVDPGRRTSGAYPLTTVTYAAASTGLPAADRKDFATMIRYAAGPGQQQGIGNGLLPPGYAPLPAKLRDQALTAATRLEAGVAPTPSPDGAAGGGSGGAGAGGTSGGDLSGGSPAAGSGAAGGSSGGAAGGGSGGKPSPSPAPAAAAGGSSGGTPGGGKNAAASTGTTPGMLLGAVRWVLLTVLVAGVAASLAGPVLLRAGTLRASGKPFLPFGSGRKSGDLSVP